MTLPAHVHRACARVCVYETERESMEAREIERAREMDTGTWRGRDWSWSVPLFSKEMVSVVQCYLPLRGKDLLSSKTRLEHTDTHIDSRGRERRRERKKIEKERGKIDR